MKGQEMQCSAVGMFWRRALACLVVPSQGRGLVVLGLVAALVLLPMLIGCGGLLGVGLSLVLRFVLVILFFWMFWFYVETMVSGCRGDMRLPEHDMTACGLDWEDFAGPFGRILFSYAWSWWGLLVYLGLSYYRGTQPEPSLVLLLWGIGMFCWPIIMLTTVVFESATSALRIDLQLGAVLKALPAYVFVCLMNAIPKGLELLYLLAWVYSDAAGELLPTGRTGAAAVVLAAPLLNIYGTLAGMHLIGTFYYGFKERFGWGVG